MTEFAPPLSEIRLALEAAGTLSDLLRMRGKEQDQDVIESVLREAGRLAADSFAPIHRAGDLAGATLEDGTARFPAGFKDAYAAFRAGGWGSVQFDETVGGQGLPYPVATASAEMWTAANTVLGILFMPLGGAVRLLQAFGSDTQRRQLIPPLVSGEWTATMAMTEPDAGTDLGAIRCRATRDGDHYRLVGQKSFSSFAAHDLADNILVFTLARTADAPAGPKGLSLFVVPHILIGEDGSPGQRNDMRYVSLEHKLGLHAMPTGILQFGDGGGAVGHLVGEENQGLQCMFTLLNRARLNVGVLGLANAERAWQQGLGYARERIQGSDGSGPVTIDYHPDVRRMLLSMKSRIDAMRALAYATAALVDRADYAPDRDARATALAQLELLTPVVKAWLTETGFDVVSTAIQVAGGVGYVEETGLAQIFREARVHSIYEGTTGVQAMDLVRRKIAPDGGQGLSELVRELSTVRTPLDESGDPGLRRTATVLGTASERLLAVAKWLSETAGTDPRRALAGSVPFLEMTATVVGGWLLAKSALFAQSIKDRGDFAPSFLDTKAPLAHFFAEHFAAPAAARADAITHCADPVLGSTVDSL